MDVPFTQNWYGGYRMRALRPERAFKKRKVSLLGRLLVGMAVMICLLGEGQSAGGLPVATEGADAPLDYQVQAAMLYKFLGYVDWPSTAFADEDSPYRITVFGAGDLEDELRKITTGRTVNDRPIEVEQVSRVDRIANPHIVFVGRRAEKYLPRLAKLARKRSFLIVTENDVELQEGSVINLRVIDGRIGFDVSLPSAQRSNVRLSARLLSVASSIRRADY